MAEQTTQVEQTAHTPGEWRIFHAPDSRGVDRPTMICAPAWGKSDLMGDFRGNEICNLCESHGNREHSYAECEANARLIAAAPDLLAALKVVEWGASVVVGYVWFSACPVCRNREIDGHKTGCQVAAAIQKAEGK